MLGEICRWEAVSRAGGFEGSLGTTLRPGGGEGAIVCEVKTVTVGAGEGEEDKGAWSCGAWL